MTVEAAPSSALTRFNPQTAFAALLVALAALAAVTTGGFLTTQNFRSVLSTLSFVGIIAVGMTLITMSGNILSLSLGATASACTLVFLATLRYGVVVAILITVAAAAAIQGLQGALIGGLGANSVIVSIAGLSIISGAAISLTDGNRVRVSGEGFDFLTGTVFGVPKEFWIMVTLAAGYQVILFATRFGRHVELIGSNETAARVGGLPVASSVTVVYVLAGVCSGVVAILLGARFGATGYESGASGAGGVQFDYDAVAAVLVGGTSILGGSGSIVRTMVGVALLEVIANVLLLRGYDTPIQVLAKGLAVSMVILLSSQRIRGPLRS